MTPASITLGPITLAVGVVALFRLVELAWARRNTARLLAEGAVEYGARQYPFFVALHASWLASLLVFVPGDVAPDWPLLGVFGLLQVGRLWVILSLGRFWTTRVITLPGAALVARGPYRWLRHPNYVVVVAELAVLPLAFGAWQLALIFTLLNAFLLAWRIRVEEAALAGRNRESQV